MKELADKKIAVLATDGVEESEILETVQALRSEGAAVDIISDHWGEIQAFRHLEKGKMIPVDMTLNEAKSKVYDGLLLPGGALNADRLRIDKRALDFVVNFDIAGKPIAAICHAPWILISANLVEGRKLTSFHAIQDDIQNAGGNWQDQSVIEDGNWVTSRQPDDIPKFNAAMIELFSRPSKMKAAAA